MNGLRKPWKSKRLYALALLAMPWAPARLDAAGSAFSVDTAEVGAPGNCKVEGWASWADNRDFVAALTPACVVDLGHPVDISAEFTRSRGDGLWTTTISPKAKINMVPTAIGRFGFAFSAIATVDTISREAVQYQLTAPATLRLSDHVRINLNAGWLHDRLLQENFFTYGAGFDWRMGGPWIATAEVFGQIGRSADFGSLVKPRWQAGLRFRPVDEFSVDVIYGRNITGENANWLTLAATVRFAPGAR